MSGRPPWTVTPLPHGKELAVRILLECILVTGHNEVVAKVIFLYLFVILFTGGGVLPQCMLGYHNPPQDQADPPGSDPPGTRQTPPGSDPPGTRQTPRIRHHPPPQDQADPTPSGSDTTPSWQTLPPPGCRLQHTVYERPVHILLECILVLLLFFLGLDYGFHTIFG